MNWLQVALTTMSRGTCTSYLSGSVPDQAPHGVHAPFAAAACGTGWPTLRAAYHAMPCHVSAAHVTTESSAHDSHPAMSSDGCPTHQCPGSACRALICGAPPSSMHTCPPLKRVSSAPEDLIQRSLRPVQRPPSELATSIQLQHLLQDLHHAIHPIFAHLGHPRKRCSHCAGVSGAARHAVTLQPPPQPSAVGASAREGGARAGTASGRSLEAAASWRRRSPPQTLKPAWLGQLTPRPAVRAAWYAPLSGCGACMHAAQGGRVLHGDHGGGVRHCTQARAVG
jgi:hypothetical protein